MTSNHGSTSKHVVVKYANGPEASAETEIDAPAQVVWPLLCDINLPGRFSEEFVRAEWLDDGPVVGATFRGYNRHPVVGEWNVVCTVTAMEQERVFEWTVGDVEFKAARWRFDLEPDGDQRSQLRFSAEMGRAPSGLTPAITRMPEREEDIVARRLGEWTDNMRRTIEGVKELAEAATEGATT